MTSKRDAPPGADPVEVAGGLLDHSWPDDILGDPPDPAPADDELPFPDDPADDWLEPDNGPDCEQAGWTDAGDVAAPPVPDEAELGALFTSAETPPQQRVAARAARVVRSLGRHRRGRIGAAALVGAVLLGVGAQLAGRDPGPAASPRAAPPSRPADDRPHREPEPNAGAHRASELRARRGRARPPRRARPRRPTRRAREGAPAAAPDPPAPPAPRHGDDGGEFSRFTSEFTP